MNTEFTLVPEGEIILRQVPIGDVGLTGSIVVLTEYRYNEENDDLDLTITAPHAAPEMLRDLFSDLSTVFGAIRVEAVED